MSFYSKLLLNTVFGSKMNT